MDRAVQQHPLHLLIRRLRTHHPLTAEDESAIRQLPYKPRKLEAQAYSMREGDPPAKCAVLVTGYAFRHKLTGDGERQILSIHIPGEALDFHNLFLGESDHNVQMLTRGDVVEVPSPAIEQLVLDYPNLGRAILINTLV